jgi:hypothetical protein
MCDSGVARNFWLVGNFTAKLFWGVGSHGQLKSHWVTVFQNVLSFPKLMFIEEKSQQPSTNRRVCSVSLYYLIKVFFDFQVSYHLLCENNHDLLWSSAGGYLGSKPRRCKKVFATDVKDFPHQVFASQIFWKMP